MEWIGTRIVEGLRWDGMEWNGIGRVGGKIEMRWEGKAMG